MTTRPASNPDFKRAAHFAAARHTGQLRKDGRTPYISHPVTVANILAIEGGVTDGVTLIAALLHDTIEDTGTTYDELAREFGADVADTVLQVTNDETLPKAAQKAAQIAKAATLDVRAAHLKVADKIANLRDILRIPPKGWNASRKMAYFDHAKSVVEAMSGVDASLIAAFQNTYREGERRIRS